ncbi:MAG: site-specific integrase, partial [Oligoflexia bacterium]|nr:site-specific integrase [Oligoflexia bacterium]
LEVDHDHIIAFKNYLDQHPDPHGRKERLYTKESVNRKFSSLSSFYLYLGRRGLLKSNPLQFVKRHHCDPENRTGDLSDLEVKRLLQQVDVRTLSGKMHLAMLLVFLNTGMRHSELRFLKKKNFFCLESFWVLRFLTKGEKERTTPLDPKCRQALEDYLAAREKEMGELKPMDYLFAPTRNRSAHTKAQEKGLKGPLASSTIDEIIKKYVRMAGIKRKLSAHSLRSTAIGSLLENGVDLGEVSEWVGHSNVNTTKRYSKRVTTLEKSPGLRMNLFSEEGSGE